MVKLRQLLFRSRAAPRRDLALLATLWPNSDFPFYDRFATDHRLQGIRLNTAAMSAEELRTDLVRACHLPNTVPLHIDVKGRQLRVEEFHFDTRYLDITINHPIEVELPVWVLFKGSTDGAQLERIEEGGRRLIFRGGPKYKVKPGESLYIRHPSLRVGGPQFTDHELAKITEAKQLGITRYFLSYVKSQRDVDEFRALVGRDAMISLKIESNEGLEYVARAFRKRDNLSLTAARGDLYVEITRPHQIAKALRLIIERDPEACVASRMLLSVIHDRVPTCADFLELAWLYDIGYRTMMLCDEICLKEDLLATAVDAFDCFRNDYAIAA